MVSSVFQVHLYRVIALLAVIERTRFLLYGAEKASGLVLLVPWETDVKGSVYTYSA